MHVLWLDTDVDKFYFSDAAIKCARSEYTLNELRKIYWCEVYPIMRHNLWDVAGEWMPIDPASLSEEIMRRYNSSRIIWLKPLRTYAYHYWEKLSSEITKIRMQPLP